MDPTLPLVLLLAGGQPSPVADLRTLGASDQRTLQRFSARWSVRFSTPRSSDEVRTPDYPASDPIAREIEAHLDAARLALAQLDEGESRRILGLAEGLIRRHPELPQAAWLRAEHLTLTAELAERTAPAEARQLRERAAALEGSRAEAFVERAPTPLPSERADPIPLEVRGLDARDELEWDGVRVTPPLVSLPGEHVARVFRRGSLLWAGWVEVTDPSGVVLGVPPLTSCGDVDLAGVRDAGTAPSAPPHVSCARWAVARHVRGELELALCRRSRCGPWQRLGPEPSAPTSGARAAGSGFPTWLTVALASAGAAVATSVVLWQTGAFETRGPPREQWTYGGFQEK